MALARAPEQPIVLNSAGGHMLRIGKPAQARELYQRAIAIDAKSKVLWLNLAVAHAREAIAANARALEVFLERELGPVRRLHSGEDQQPISSA
jgi:Tfp pilus assembly protein PilF